MTTEQGMSRHRPRFLSLPTTPMGRWAGRLLIAALLLVVLNTAVLMPITERHAGLSLLQTVFNVVVGLSVVSAGVCGVLGWMRQGDRSWVVVLSTLLLALLAAMMVQDLVTPG